MRIIPKNTRVSMEIFKGVGLLDIVVGTLGFIVIAGLFLSSIPFKYVFIVITLLAFILLLTKFGEDSNYIVLYNYFKNLFSKKVFVRDEVFQFEAFSDIKDGIISNITLEFLSKLYLEYWQNN